MKKTLTLLLLLQAFTFTAFSQKTTYLAPTPPMGWNSWNYFGKNKINENIIKESMDAMVSSGLLEAGYNLFVIDGGWRDTTLNEDGSLRPHPVKFPNGIKPLADYAHSKGLKFGLHTVPGSHDCAGDAVGAFGIEEVHIQQFIDWGLDFVKVDRCQLHKGCEGKNCWDEATIEQTYRKWRTILNEKNSNILLSISAYKFRDWNPEICNMSRTTGDISCKITRGGAYLTEADKKDRNGHMGSVLGIAHINNQYAKYAKPGYWNDPDMLVTGDNGLTVPEQQAHFALWCVMSSPLFLGNDPRNISSEEKKIILNKKAIAINQDPSEQGVKLFTKDGVEYWKKNLRNGSTALVVINGTAQETVSVSLDWAALKIEKATKVFDVYSDKKIKSKKEIKFDLEAHACRFLLIK